MLQFCISQQLNKAPFIFRSTGIRVYSLEEALYHVFHYWRESVDDFLSPEMIAWASELGLSFVVAKMHEIAEEKHFTTRILGFLQLIKYFSPSELGHLQSELEAWERRCEWEKLKERADFFVERGDPFKALPLYKRALQLKKVALPLFTSQTKFNFLEDKKAALPLSTTQKHCNFLENEENAALLNNIGVAYMQLSLAKKAAGYLACAYALEPDNISVMLHYIEAAILGKQFETATQVLEKAEPLVPDSADIQFLHGLMAYKQKNYNQALTYYEKATKLDPVASYYVYKMADTYKEMRQYKQALHVLSRVANKDAEYYVKEAEIHAAAGDVPASLRCMRNATSGDGANNANLWAKLAEYYRRDYDWRRAEKAITHALELAPDNDKVWLESTRIKKGLGRTREYQAGLATMLQSFKGRYRADV